MRLLHELDYSVCASFVSLSYDDDHLPPGGSLRPKDLQDFLKRVRHHVDGIKYYAVGEYGEVTNRPHYHGIFFGVGPDDVDVVRNDWGHGFVYFGTVTVKSINYVTAYINKKLYGKMAIDEYAGRVEPFARMSKGLGLRWLKDNEDHVCQNVGVRKEGHVVPAPRYYMKKLSDAFTDEFWNARRLEKSRLKDSRMAKARLDPVGLTDRVLKGRRQTEADLKAKESMREKSWKM